MSEETRHVRQIEVIAEATSVHKWKKRVVAGQQGQKQFTFLSDEGSYAWRRKFRAHTSHLFRIRRGALIALSSVAGCGKEEIDLTQRTRESNRTFQGGRLGAWRHANWDM